MQALILAGGLGTRLKSIVNDRPKPMILINNIPFLEILINRLKNQDICHIIIAVGYKCKSIIDYFKDGSNFGVSIKYSIENTLLGTGGAIKNAMSLIECSQLLVLNGDTFFDLDYNEMSRFHNNNSSCLTIALKETEDLQRYGSVKLDGDNRVIDFCEKNNGLLSSYINGGSYIFNKNLIDDIEGNKKISLEKDILPKIINCSFTYGFVSTNYFRDIGVPEDYIKFCDDVKKGVIL